jgi:ketosteroid isomerase-like protein
VLLERADELRALDTVLEAGGDIQDVLAAGERVVVLCTVSAERHGQSWSSPEVHVWRVTGGRAVDFCEFQGNEHTEDAFWSA